MSTSDEGIEVSSRKHSDDDVDALGGRQRRQKRRLVRKYRFMGLVCVAGVFGIVLACSHVYAGATSVRKSVGLREGSDEDGNASGRRLDAKAPNDNGPVEAVSMASVSFVRRWLADGEEMDEPVEDTTSSSTDDSCLDNKLADDAGWFRLLILAVAILFTFNGLAIVCDDFFQASLEKISEVSERESSGRGPPYIHLAPYCWCCCHCYAHRVIENAFPVRLLYFRS